MDLFGHTGREEYIVLIHPEAVPDAYHMIHAALDAQVEYSILSYAHERSIDVDLEGGFAGIKDRYRCIARGRCSRRLQC